ncbi:MAG: hypothetical protein U0165_19335 [Polyangiaceae bacterium]
MGLRDDMLGFACQGWNIQTGLVELRSNRSGEIQPLHTVDHSELGIMSNAGVSALDVSAGGRVALGTFRDGGFHGPFDAGWAYNPTTYGTSLYMYDVAWKSEKELWIAGPASHDNGDPPNLADNGPRGATLLTLDNTERSRVRSTMSACRATPTRSRSFLRAMCVM